MVYIGNYSKCAWKMYILLLFGGVFCISLRSLCLYQILSSYFIHYRKLILTCTIIVSFFLLSFPSVCFNILELCYLMYIWLWLLYLLGELTFSQYIMLFFIPWFLGSSALVMGKQGQIFITTHCRMLTPISQALSLNLHSNCLIWGPFWHLMKPGAFVRWGTND